MSSLVKAVQKKKLKKNPQRLGPNGSPGGVSNSGVEERPFWASRRRRSTRKPLHRLTRTKGVHPLEWGAESSIPTLLNGPGETWTQPNMPPSALECLAVAHWLAQQVETIDAATGERYLRWLTDLAEDAIAIHGLRDVWESQVFGAELPITLAYSFGVHGSHRQLGQAGVEYLETSLEHLIDAEGILTEAPVEQIMPLLACWTRCCILIAASPKLTLRRSARRRYSAFVRYVLRLLDRHLAVPFESALGASARRARRAMLCAVRQCLPSQKTRRMLRQTASRRGIRRDQKGTARLLAGDDGSTALLQSDWRSTRGRLLIDFSHPVQRIQLFRDPDTILSGSWNPAITVAGCAQEPRSTWEVLFSYSDADIDLVELESELAGPWRLQRQFLLAKEDAFVYLADLVYGPTEEVLAYSLPLPLPAEAAWSGARDSRECQCICGGRRVRFLPLAAPEWRREPSPCELDTAATTLSVRHDQPVSRLYAPLFIDLHPQRRKCELTWRQLSVAENLQRVSADRAVGYRVQVGREQWLIYRSFTRVGNRTVLGQNLSSEFFCGRFLHDGTAETLIEIETDPPARSGSTSEMAHVSGG